MKRDMDLCRKVLHVIEDGNDRPHAIGVEDLGDEISDVTQEALNYHVKLLIEAGLVNSGGTLVRGIPVVRGLTWKGHDFVETSRDQGLWEKAKQTVKEKTGGLTLELLSAALAAVAKKALGLED
jgi:DNA-binding transcriptional ArsR family regulator